MASTMKKLEKSTVQVNVTLPAQAFSEALERAYTRERGHFAVQGFRKGRAPRKVIEAHYGKDIFFEGAVDDLAPKALADACEEHKIDIVGRPSVAIESAKEGEDLKLIFTMAVYPEVELGDYKGLSIEKQEATVTPEMVQAELERARDARVRYVEVDRPIQQGDRIIFDYKGKIGEDYFEGGTAEKAQLDIGSGQFIPGFEDAMVGIETGAWREIPVQFPEQYHAEELAGKHAVFEVFVHEVREREMPEIDDDLAKDASEFDTLDEWKADIQKNLQEQAERTAKTAMQNEVIEKAAENAKLEIPDAMIEAQMDNIVRDFATRLQYQGLKLEDYCKYAGITLQEMREQTRPDAERRVKNQIVLDEITKREEIKATDEEVQKRIAEYAERYGQKVEEFEKNLTEQDRTYFAEDVAIEKTLDFLLDNAKQVKPKKSAAKKTAKKADAEADGEKPKKSTAKKTAKKDAEKAEAAVEEKPKKAAAKKTAKKDAEKAEAAAEEKPKKAPAKKTAKKSAKADNQPAE